MINNPSHFFITQLKTSRLVKFVNIKYASKCFLLLVILVQGCGSVPPRNGLPQELSEQAQIPGIPDARYWGDEAPQYTDEWFALSDAEIRKRYSAVYGAEHNMLALSGGGARGAFGAGLLVGWSAAGTRPRFDMVTGISTGALIAPFAFLGPEYDKQLKEVYTQYSTKDLLKKRGTLTGLTSDAMADTSQLRAMIAKYVDDDMVQAIAKEYRKGRELNIGTTNLDAKRPVIWDIGRIAVSGTPRAKDLIHDIILASASIPVAFPPVMIEVEARGQRYDEMHMDGGMASQVFVYPLGIDWRRVEEKLAVKGTPRLYVIRNSKLQPKWKTIERSVRPIAGSSISSLIRTQGIGDMLRIYAGAKRDGLEYHLAYIPDDFNQESQEAFDSKYMNNLFELAYNLAKQGYPWESLPPGIGLK
jgi:predicted patatin/cPLA2 family phospholipase